MKILKCGKLPPTKHFNGKCIHCGCEIETTQEEVRTDTFFSKITYSVACPTEGCHYRIIVKEIKEETIQESADSFDTSQRAMKSLEEPRIEGNIFAEAEVKLQGILPQYPINYGKEVPIEKPKSELADAFEKFFSDPSDTFAPPKKTPRKMNELSCLADEIIYGEIHHSGNH